MTIHLETIEPCSDCIARLTGTSVFKRSQGLVQIGQAVATGPKKDTIYEYLQCPKCGSLWQSTEDSGFGGHGHYLDPVHGVIMSYKSRREPK